MKNILLATSALLVATAVPASAADLAPHPVAKAPVVQPFSWAGVYIGAHGGYALGSHDIRNFTTAPAEYAGVDPSGGLFGVQVGYNSYLTPNWVLGYELDISGAGLSDSANATPSGFVTESKIDYLGTARARIGYATDRWLVYATGGTAWVHNKVTAFAGTSPYFTRDQYQLGWTAGVGAEYAIAPNWSIKAEYLYADLGKNRHLTVGAYEQETELTLNILRLGVNYRFDNSAPASAASPAYPVKARPLPVSTWAGGYIGAHGGYVWNSISAFDGFQVADGSIDADGGFAGFTTGYNWLLTPNWLVGLESETSFAWTENTIIVPVPTSRVEAKVDYFGSERVRLGYVAGDWLFYGTGGLAWARVNYDIRGGIAAPPYENTKHYGIGWTAGAGVEWMFAPQWSAKVEYLYADYGTYESLSFGSVPRYVSTTSDSVKVGVNYHGDILGALFR